MDTEAGAGVEDKGEATVDTAARTGVGDKGEAATDTGAKAGVGDNDETAMDTEARAGVGDKGEAPADTAAKAGVGEKNDVSAGMEIGAVSGEMAGGMGLREDWRGGRSVRGVRASWAPRWSSNSMTAASTLLPSTTTCNKVFGYTTHHWDMFADVCC